VAQPPVRRSVSMSTTPGWGAACGRAVSPLLLSTFSSLSYPPILSTQPHPPCRPRTYSPPHQLYRFTETRPSGPPWTRAISRSLEAAPAVRLHRTRFTRAAPAAPVASPLKVDLSSCPVASLDEGFVQHLTSSRPSRRPVSSIVSAFGIL